MKITDKTEVDTNQISSKTANIAGFILFILLFILVMCSCSIKENSPTIKNKPAINTLGIKPEPLYFTGDIIGEYEVVLVSDIYPYHYLVKFVGYSNVYSITEDSLKRFEK